MTRRFSGEDEERALSARIMGLDDENTILKKVRSAKTDSQIAVDVTNISPGVRNLLDIYHAFEGGDYHATLRHFDGASYGRLKTGERARRSGSCPDSRTLSRPA